MAPHSDSDADADASAAHTPLEEALEAVEQGDVDTAIEELGHFIESATGTELTEAQEALALLQAGDLHEAEDIIAELLGMAPHSD